MPRQKTHIDYPLLIIVSMLILIGLLMIFSASFQITYLQRQFFSLLLGLVFFMIGFSTDYHFYRKTVFPLFILTVFLLVLTYLPWFYHSAGGASRWLNFGGFIFQPSEFAKITVVFFLASALENKKKYILNFWQGLLPILLTLGIILALVVNQPDLGTTILISAIAGFMLFIGGAKTWHLTLLGIAGFRVVYWIIERNPYQRDRIQAFFNPWQYQLDIGFHTIQSYIAIGSGGFFGLGLGRSIQKFSYLPQPFTDYIYAVICEELGLIGGALIILLFVLFSIRALRIAKLAQDRLGMLIASGVTAWISVEAFLNIGVVLGIIPATGIPLVFVSFGGSSLLSALFAVGVLCNIAKKIEH